MRITNWDKGYLKYFKKISNWSALPSKELFNEACRNYPKFKKTNGFYTKIKYLSCFCGIDRLIFVAVAILTLEQILSNSSSSDITVCRSKLSTLSNSEEGGRWDLNPRMVVPQTTALTTWLRPPCILLRYYNTIACYFWLII